MSGKSGRIGLVGRGGGWRGVATGRGGGWLGGGATVAVGAVPDRLDGAVHAGPLDEAAPGRYLLRLPTVGSFLAETEIEAAGVRVTVQPVPGATDADVACLLAGPVRQACWLLQGSFALRGCAAVIGDSAVAITGGPAVGKSAVTAALARRGHRILADGAVPIRAGSRRSPARRDGRPEMIVGAVDDSVQLWPRAVRLLGLDGPGDLIRPALSKRRYRFAAAAPARLDLVVALQRHAGVGNVSVESIRGLAAIDLLAACTAMYPLVKPLGAGGAHFGWIAGLASAARVVRMRTDRHRSDLPAVADAVEALVDAVEALVDRDAGTEEALSAAGRR